MKYPALTTSLVFYLLIGLSKAHGAEARPDSSTSAYFQLRQFDGSEFEYDGDDQVWKVHFLRKRVFPTDIKMLEGFPKLSHLELGGSDADDEIFLALSKAKLRNLTNLDLEGCSITDAGMVHLGRVKQIAHLGLAGTMITDEGLRHLKDFKNLQTLDLSRRADTSFSLEFTDNGVKRIANFPDREKVQTHITGAGLIHLAKLKQLKGLYLDGANIEDRGLLHLADLNQLEALDLSRTSISDAGLIHLKNLTNMEHLRLDETQITDGGLSHLQHMTNMDWISLEGTKITNDGLSFLKDYRKLKTLTLSKTKVTNEGLKQIAHLNSLQMIFASETELDDTGEEYFRMKSNSVDIWKE